MKPRVKLPDDLVNRLAAFNATYELMKQDEQVSLISELATAMVETLPLRKRIHIKVKMVFVRWWLWLRDFIKGEL